MSQMRRTGPAWLMLMVLAQATARAADESATIQADATKAAPLSVAPLEQAEYPEVEYPEDRPEWINAPTNLKELPHSWIIVSEPCETAEQSLNELRQLQLASVEVYLKTLPGADGRFDYFPLTDEWIQDRLVVQEYEGLVIQEGLTLHENAAQLRIDSDARREMMVALKNSRDEMMAALKNDTVGQRLGLLGVLGAAGLFGLICSSALFSALSRRATRRESAQVSTR